MLLDLFGIAVANERVKLGLTQSDLAEKSNLHRNYISDVERGTRNLSLKAIAAFADGLNISISEIFLKMESLEGLKNDNYTKKI
ncbi:MAG: helix-turn-helix transcriptional regulator [Erysipelotrichaceae bacterium]